MPNASTNDGSFEMFAALTAFVNAGPILLDASGVRLARRAAVVHRTALLRCDLELARDREQRRVGGGELVPLLPGRSRHHLEDLGERRIVLHALRDLGVARGDRLDQRVVLVEHRGLVLARRGSVELGDQPLAIEAMRIARAGGPREVVLAMEAPVDKRHPRGLSQLIAEDVGEPDCLPGSAAQRPLHVAALEELRDLEQLALRSGLIGERERLATGVLRRGRRSSRRGRRGGRPRGR